MNPTSTPSVSTPVKKVPLLDVGRGNSPLKEEILNSVAEIIDSGWFIGGPFVQSLEQSVAEITGAQFAIGCASGSDALLLALMALEIGPGDEVICPSFTFFATASAIHRLGATPVFVDICPTTFNLDPAKLAESITPRTRALIPVHLFGQCAAMDEIVAIADEHELEIVEDCAQSIGATDRGRGSGSMGAIGCFSFYPTKNLGGFGDGGMLTTNDEALADRLRLLANHGMRPRYYHSEVGINSRLDAIQAAALCAKIKHLDEYSEGRQQNALRYQQLMAQSGLADIVGVPQARPEANHVWNQFTIRIPHGHRDAVRAYLADCQVGSEIYYPIPLHQQACFHDLPPAIGGLEETERAAAEVLALPIFPELSEAEQAYVVDCLDQALQTVGLGTLQRSA